MATSTTGRPPRVILFPFPAQGHVIPFLDLAKLIATRHPGRLRVTLVTTPVNARSIQRSLPSHSGVVLRTIPFPGAEHGLPDDVENADSVPSKDLIKVFKASSGLRHPFERLVEEELPVCIISDIFLAWTVHVANRHGIFQAVFSTCGGFGTAAYFSLWLHLPHLHCKSEEEEFGLPGFPERFRLRRSQLSHTLRAAGDDDPWSPLLRDCISLSMTSKGMLCNTVEGLEPSGLEILKKVIGIKVWPVWRRSAGERVVKLNGLSPEACTKWLSNHRPRSVIYVAFGSQNTVSSAQMMALASGLEASSRPFIWVVRPPAEFDVQDEFKDEWLPMGYEERVTKSGQGLLVRKWAPQLEILGHWAVGCFLSHCGWNSTLESLSNGVPVISWPMAAEQFYNSKMLEEEMGVGVELARGVKQEVSSVEVERVVEMVMGSEKGEDMRRSAVAAAKTMRAATVEDGSEVGSSLVALDDFLATVVDTMQ